MKLKDVLVISSIYMVLLGVGFIFIPINVGAGAVPADASPALIAYLRVFGSTFIAIALLNWLSLRAKPSTSLDAIVIANIVGFGLAAVLDFYGALNGARQLAWVCGVVYLVFMIVFIWSRPKVTGAQQVSTTP